MHCDVVGVLLVVTVHVNDYFFIFLNFTKSNVHLINQYKLNQQYQGISLQYETTKRGERVSLFVCVRVCVHVYDL